MWRHACVVTLCLLAACGEAQVLPGAAAKAALPAADQVPNKFPLIKKMLEGKLPSIKMPSLKRAELDAKLTSALAKRHFGLRDLAEKATGALAGGGRASARCAACLQKEVRVAQASSKVVSQVGKRFRASS